MKRIILIIVILMVIGLFGGHALLSRQFEQKLSSYASQVAPHGRLTWDGTSISHTGKVTVRRLRFQPHGSRDQVLLDTLVFDSGSLGGLINFGRMLDHDLLPSSLRITVRSLNVPVNRQLSDWIGPLNPGLPLASAGCEEFDPFNLYHLGDINLISTTINLLIDYQTVNQGNDLDLHLVLSASQLGESNTRLRLALNDPSRSIHEVQQTLARTRLLTGSHTYTDLGFYPRLLEMCAEHAEQSVDEYINHHINAWIGKWAELGLEPGRLAIVAYRHFLLQPGTVSFTTDPDVAPLLGEFSRTRFTNLVGDIPVQFSVEDGTPVDLVFGRIDPPPQPEVSPPAEIVEETAPEIIFEDEDGIVVGTPAGWKSISVAEIGNYVDHRARIETIDRTRFSGRILEVADDAVYLSIQTRQGILMRPIPLRSIATVHVRR